MGSYTVPEFDFGAFQAPSLGDPSSSLYRTYKELASSAEAPEGLDETRDDEPRGSPSHAITPEPAQKPEADTVAQPSPVLAQDNSKEYGPAVLGANSGSDDETDDNELQRALRLSRKTAAEEDVRRQSMACWIDSSAPARIPYAQEPDAPIYSTGPRDQKDETSRGRPGRKDSRAQPSSFYAPVGVPMQAPPMYSVLQPPTMRLWPPSEQPGYYPDQPTFLRDMDRSTGVMFPQKPSSAAAYDTDRFSRPVIRRSVPVDDMADNHDGPARSMGPPRSASPASARLPRPQSSIGTMDPSLQTRRDSPPKGRLDVRGKSRIRDQSVTSSRTASSGELCDSCGNIAVDTAYCNVCRIVYCNTCWDMQVVHRKKPPASGGLPHEKTNLSMAKKIQDALAPNLTESDRTKLHINDIETTWFGIVREGAELPLMADYNRYANLIARVKELRLDRANLLTSTSLSQDDTLYPSLVSFVGQTRAGKSTLIKLLIDLNSQSEDMIFPTPVVGAHGRDVPTSEDVHLYLDSQSSLSPESQNPLLFADCEGLDGGARDPVGAKHRKHADRQGKPESSLAGARHRKRLKPASERPLLWAAESDQKKMREFAVANLYPRLLYTFSDVIVFVLRNARTIEGVVSRLVDWAQKALELSSNQPVLPHVVLALNASENDIPEELWDVDTATVTLMEELSGAVESNPALKRHAEYWRNLDRQVASVEQLVLSYYSSIRVVRIPTDGIPNRIQGQVRRLSDEINKSCIAARERKADLRMLLNSDELTPYLQVAFDHFAKHLDTPFDFVQASFANSPIPNDFGGNILKLAIQVMDYRSSVTRGQQIFKPLSSVIASCIMFDIARNRYVGQPKDIFPEYIEHIDNALENFCDRHWPCEYVSPKPRGGRCVNVRSGHGAKGHQMKSGKLLETGDYESTFLFRDYQRTFQDAVYGILDQLHKRVRDRMAEGMSEERAAAEVHKEFILLSFFELQFDGNTREYISHSVCFACLFEPPEHALPCGHIICTPCLKTYGKCYLNNLYVEITECPLEPRERRWKTPWKVYLKPASAGVRVLTLDGGGIRGIVELEILKALEKTLGGRINVQSFFDLIVGTSTGGIIALGLTARNWTVKTCSEQFETLCREAFHLRKGMGLPVVNKFIENYNHSKYETSPFENALRSTFGDKTYLFGGQREDHDRVDVKVAVTATSSAGTSVVFSNYNRLCTEKLQYHFQRPEKPDFEMKTWEAARATSAAPTYFKPLAHEPTKQSYFDGGVYHNNPIKVADQERKLLWPAQQDSEPDIVLSLGTGYCGKAKERTPSVWRPTSTGILSHTRFLSRMAWDHIRMSLDSESTWRDYLKIKQPKEEVRRRYIRINPKIPEPLPKLDAFDELQMLTERTRLFLDANPEIISLAHRLVATCFYFDCGPVHEVANVDTLEVSGYLKCRFLTGPDVAELGKYIKSNAIAGHDPLFLIREEDSDSDQPQEVRLDKAVLTRMTETSQFRIDRPISIRRANRFSRTEISLCLSRGTEYPISGFPRKLHSDQPSSTAKRPFSSSTHSMRWATRSRSSQQRKPGWKPPTKENHAPLEKQDIIEMYRESIHVQPMDLVDAEVTIRVTSNTRRHRNSEMPAQNASPVELPYDERVLPVSGEFIVTEACHMRRQAGDDVNLLRGERVTVVDMRNPRLYLGRLEMSRGLDWGLGWIPSEKLAPVSRVTTPSRVIYELA